MPPSVSRAHLFVYGTLKRGFSPWARRLWSQARYAGEATLPGRLVSIGPFPAFVEDGAAGSLVHGEVAALQDEGVLELLDRYEGPRYRRVLRRVKMQNGRELDAWVYLYRAPLVHACPVPGGRWP